MAYPLLKNNFSKPNKSFLGYKSTAGSKHQIHASSMANSVADSPSQHPRGNRGSSNLFAQDGRFKPLKGNLSLPYQDNFRAQKPQVHSLHSSVNSRVGDLTAGEPFNSFSHQRPSRKVKGIRIIERGGDSQRSSLSGSNRPGEKQWTESADAYAAYDGGAYQSTSREPS